MEKDIKNGQPFTLLIFNYLEISASFYIFQFFSFLTVALSNSCKKVLV